MDCRQCNYRPKCRRLCDRARKYADQDYRYQREHCFSYISGCRPDCIDERDNAFLLAAPTTKIIIAKLFFIHKLNQAEIADITYKSQQYISRVIAETKRKKRAKRHKKYIVYND